MECSVFNFQESAVGKGASGHRFNSHERQESAPPVNSQDRQHHEKQKKRGRAGWVFGALELVTACPLPDCAYDAVELLWCRCFLTEYRNAFFGPRDIAPVFLHQRDVLLHRL